MLFRSLGSNNASNVVKATLGALQQMRLREDIYKSRGLVLRDKKDKPAAAPVVVTA